MIKKDKNDVLIHTKYDMAFGGCYGQFAVINDDSGDYQRITIYQFGGSGFARYGSNIVNRVDIDMKTHSYTSRRLKNISCPQSSNQYDRMHIVFC